MTRDEKIAEARRLRGKGWTRKALASHFNVSRSTIDYWFNPKSKESRRAGLKQWRLDNPEKCKVAIRKYNAKLRNKCKNAIRQSEIKALLKGHKPILDDWETLYLAWQHQGGMCLICGRGEWELVRRLSAHHDHDLGKFLYWACDFCNTGVGRFEDCPDRLERAATAQRMELTPWG